MPNPELPVATHAYTGPRRSLILAGGGMRLAYQAGVIKALQEEGLQFNHVDGTSGGIFNTAMLASGVPATEMGRNWRRVSIKNFTSPSPVKSYLRPVNMMGYTDADGIRKKVFPVLGIDMKKVNANTHFLATFNVCNFTDKSVESISNHRVQEDHLIAGVSLPIVMPALLIEGNWYTDSVWIKDANLVEAVNQGAEEIWLVWAIGNCSEYLPGALNQYVHMIEMSANGGLLEEYARLKLMLEKRSATDISPKSVRFHVIKPAIPLPLDTDLYLNKIDARSLINWGYADAKSYLANLSPEGIAYDMEATRMQSPGTRLNFRCTFEAPLKLGIQPTQVRYYAYFSFRQSGSESEIILHASIGFGDSEDEISTFNNQVTIVQNRLLIRSLFIYQNEQHVLNAEIKMNSPIDWLLGLEFKRARLTIINLSSKSPLLEGYVFQNIRHRLRGLLTTNLRYPDGTGGGLFKKLRFITKFFRHEI